MRICNDVSGNTQDHDPGLVPRIDRDSIAGSIVSGHLVVRFAGPIPASDAADASRAPASLVDEVLAAEGFTAGQILALSIPAVPDSGEDVLSLFALSSESGEAVEKITDSPLHAQSSPADGAGRAKGPWIYTPVGERRGSATPGEHLVFAGTNALPGRDDDLNEWYDHVHLAEALALTGFLSAQRFRLADVQLPGAATESAPHRYLAVYEATGATEALWDQITTFPFALTDAVDFSTAATSIYTSVVRKGSLAVPVDLDQPAT